MDKKPKEYWGRTLVELGLTIEQFNEVADKYELNICDKCGIIESTYDLLWLEHDDRITEDEWKVVSANGAYVALCQLCLNDQRKAKI